MIASLLRETGHAMSKDQAVSSRLRTTRSRLKKVKLPKRPHNGRHNDQASLRGTKLVEELH